MDFLTVIKIISKQKTVKKENVFDIESRFSYTKTKKGRRFSYNYQDNNHKYNYSHEGKEKKMTIWNTEL